MDGTVYIEFFDHIPAYIGLGLQTIIALFLGGMVGYDREKKSKAAGLKTHMLICLGASVFTSIGILISQSYPTIGDPNRISAQIVSGIGFLGAGAILRGRQGVAGLTSAATIWLVAAIGFTVGAGYIFSATGFTLTVIFVLTLIHPLYKYLEKEKEYQYFQMEVQSIGSIKRVLTGLVLTEDVELDEIIEEEFDIKKGRMITSVFLKAHARQMDRIVNEAHSLLKVEKVSFHTVAGNINKLIKFYKEDLEES